MDAAVVGRLGEEMSAKFYDEDEYDEDFEDCESDVERIQNYKPFTDEIRNHPEIPTFQKLLIEEKIDNLTLKGSDLRMCYRSAGILIPVDLEGIE